MQRLVAGPTQGILGSMRTILSFVLFMSIAVSGMSAAQAERRVALVIGNSAYEHTASLANPKSDAEAVAASLERLGFEVLTGLDADIHQMIGLVRDFSRALEGADVALFYYAGHGLQVDGNNYLAPVDAELNDQADLDFGTVKLSSILRQMDRHRAANLVFLDACRDNPLSKTLARSISVGRSVDFGRGLARVEAGIGTLIAYATQPGNIALDGDTGEGHSPFTKALLTHMETPGLDIGNMMIKVRRDVISATKQKQVPWDHSSLTGQFYFKPAGETKTEQVAAVNPAETNETTSRSVADGNVRVAETRLEAGQNAMELAFWNTIKDSNDPDLLQTYLNRFPEGVYADLARVLIARARRNTGPDTSEVAAINPEIPQQDQPVQEQPIGAEEPETPEAGPEEEAVRDAGEEQNAGEEQSSDVAGDEQPAGQQPVEASELENTAAEEPQPVETAAAGNPEDQGLDQQTMLAELRRKALDGDRDAALELARHFDGAEEADRAAGYALIVLDKGGAGYTAPFITDTKAWSKPFWSALQAHLKDEGMYGGAIDGLPGRGTKTAVQKYAGIEVAVQPVAAQQPKRGTKPPRGNQPVRQAKPKGPPTRGKPPPNRWCLIDPNGARCTNQ